MATKNTSFKESKIFRVTAHYNGIVAIKPLPGNNIKNILEEVITFFNENSKKFGIERMNILIKGLSIPVSTGSTLDELSQKYLESFENATLEDVIS